MNWVAGLQSVWKTKGTAGLKEWWSIVCLLTGGLSQGSTPKTTLFKTFTNADDGMENTLINFADDIKLQEQSLC